MTFQTLLFEIENGICTITINRPDKLNALNAQVFTDLDAAINEVENNIDIKTVIITGSGSKAFVAGADISEFASLNETEGMALARRGQEIFFKIENCSKPVVAAVNGYALGGGCELAMACHFRICSDNASFGQPEVNLGITAGYGGTQRLTQLVGKGKGMEMHMTGIAIDALEALRLGLANHVTSGDNLLNKTKEILTLIQKKAPLAVAKVVECINAYYSEPGNAGFEKEINAFGECFRTEDLKEGTTAFMEKRKPAFTGK